MKPVRLAVMSLALAASVAPLARAQIVCGSFSQENRGLNLGNTPLPQDPNAALTLNQAIAFYNSYFGAWFDAARQAAKISPALLPSDEYWAVMSYYADDLALTAKDTGLLGSADIVIPPVPGLARTLFFDAFLYKQPGNVHLGDHLCVSGNTVSVGFQYYAPYPGKVLDRYQPNAEQAAVSAPVMESVTIVGGKIKTITFRYDFYWFAVASAAGGIPLN